MNHKTWTAERIPDQTGRTILITGANSGLGLEAARILHGKGARLVLAVRDLKKGREAAASFLGHGTAPDVLPLDLADFDSIRRFVQEFRSRHGQLHVLMNNAGVMMPRRREETKDGHELQFGTNHLGHFSLTGRLLDLLVATPGSRVVTQSSIMHRMTSGLDFGDLDGARTYRRTTAYANSKLCNLYFAYELDRRMKARGIPVLSVASHPGYSATNLQRTSGPVVAMLNKVVAQSAAMGTLPVLQGATDPSLVGGEFLGPLGWGGMRGYPRISSSSGLSRDLEAARRLWEVSEAMTGVVFPFGG